MLANTDIEKIATAGERNTAEAKIDAALEYWLKPFLVPDWRRAGAESSERNKQASYEIEAQVQEGPTKATQHGATRFEAEIVRINKFLRSA
jgi:hypothetical protein